jgi:hypothetical protein
MIVEQANPCLMQAIIATEGQGFSDQTSAALAQGMVEPFNMRSLAR